MKKLLKKIVFNLFLFIFLVIVNVNLFLILAKNIQNHDNIEVILSAIVNSGYEDLEKNKITTGISVKDGRVANLKAFFRKYNSPLYDHAEKIVEVSDRYQFDYRLIPAIAMQESNLCKYIPENSYNCWGWGIYGDQVLRFKNYDEAIEIVAKGLKTHYIDKGLVTASQIMKKYTPSSNGSWAFGVNTFLKALE